MHVLSLLNLILPSAGVFEGSFWISKRKSFAERALELRAAVRITLKHVALVSFGSRYRLKGAVARG
jgi:hypothetical protein